MAKLRQLDAAKAGRPGADLERKLHRTIVGQDEAIHHIVRAYQTGLNAPEAFRYFDKGNTAVLGKGFAVGPISRDNGDQGSSRIITEARACTRSQQSLRLNN